MGVYVQGISLVGRSVVQFDRIPYVSVSSNKWKSWVQSCAARWQREDFTSQRKLKGTIIGTIIFKKNDFKSAFRGSPSQEFLNLVPQDLGLKHIGGGCFSCEEVVKNEARIDSCISAFIDIAQDNAQDLGVRLAAANSISQFFSDGSCAFWSDTAVLRLQSLRQEASLPFKLRGVLSLLV